MYICMYIYRYWYDVDLFLQYLLLLLSLLYCNEAYPPQFFRSESRGEIHIPSLWLSARTQGEPQNGGCLP